MIKSTLFGLRCLCGNDLRASDSCGIKLPVTLECQKCWTMTEIIPLNPSPRPAPPRREAPPILALGTKVYVRPTNDHPGTGTIRGVTYKAQPVYDVRLEDGRWLRGLAADQVEAL